MASRRGRLACLVTFACLAFSGCDPEEGTTVHVAFEVVGPPPQAGTFCATPEMWWLAKRVDGADVNVSVIAFGEMNGEPDDDGPECIWRKGPEGSLLSPGRYRIVATDGDWLAVCPQVISLFLSANNQAFHRVRFEQGAPGCEVTIGP